MLNQKMAEAFNKQINNEIYSAYLYKALSAYSAHIGLNGMANWFAVQVQEELFHAQKMYDYVLERDGKIKLFAIAEPPADFESPEVMFEQTLKHEQFITKCINELMDLAIIEKDHASRIFLQWYVSEQVEEESGVKDILNSLKFIGDNSNGLRMFDKELATRVFTPPINE